MWHYCDTVSTPVSRRRRVPREEARRRIVEAAARLLATTRFRDLTVDVVMTEAGLPRTIFYRHFDGLPHLVLGLLDELVDQTEAAAETAPDLDDPELLRSMLAHAVDTFARYGPLFLAIDEASRHDEEVERAYRATTERAIALTEALMVDGIQTGRITRQVSPPDMARALTLLNGNYLLDTLGREPRADPDMVLETLWTVWTGALGFRGIADRV